MGEGRPLCLHCLGEDKNTTTVRFEGDEEDSIDCNHNPSFPLLEFVGSAHHQQSSKATKNGEWHDDVKNEIVPRIRDREGVNQSSNTDGKQRVGNV